jgi:preprotein translocase subunit YajC
MIFGAFLAGPQSASGQTAASPWAFPIMMVAIFAIFYFLMIAPQRKKQKKHQEEVQNLTSGRQVITIGGIVGTVVGFKKDDRLGDLVELRIGSGTTISIIRSAVGRIVDTERPEVK